MKKKFELAFSLFSPHLLWEVTLILQIVVYLACSVSLISNFVQQQGIYHSFKEKFSDECVYFQPYDRLVELFADPETSTEMRAELFSEILSYAQQIVPDCDIGTVVKAIGEADHQLVKVVGYNRPMAENLGIYDYWEHTYYNSKTEIPVLIRGALCDRYMIGDHLSLAIDEATTLSAVVIGMLDMDFRLVLPSYGASKPTIDSFFDDDIIADDSRQNANTVVFCYAGNEAWLKNLVNPACFIFANGNSVSIEYLAFQNGAIGGRYFMMSELIDNTIEQNLYVNRKPIGKVVAASFFTIVSLFGYVFLLFIRNQKLLGVYTLLGMSRKCMYSVISLAIAICSIVAVILYVLFSSLALHLGIFIVTNASLSVMTYAIVLVFISLLSGTVVCSLFISHWQPIQYLRGD